MKACQRVGVEMSVAANSRQVRLLAMQENGPDGLDVREDVRRSPALPRNVQRRRFPKRIGARRRVRALPHDWMHQRDFFQPCFGVFPPWTFRFSPQPDRKEGSRMRLMGPMRRMNEMIGLHPRPMTSQARHKIAALHQPRAPRCVVPRERETAKRLLREVPRSIGRECPSGGRGMYQRWLW